MRITGAQVFDLQEGFVQRDICFDGRLLSGSSAESRRPSKQMSRWTKPSCRSNT